MKMRYDAATDALYIHLSERVSVDADEVSEGVVLDDDATDALVGIDIQHASRQADLAHIAVSRLPVEQLDAA